MTIHRNDTSQPSSQRTEQRPTTIVNTTTRQIITDENPVTVIHPAAMSGHGEETAGGLTSPAAKPTEKHQGTGKNIADTAQEEGASQASVPRSMPESSENEGEIVPAAGRINDKGEVIDDEGNAIGKVVEGNAHKFNNFIVTQEGDILNEEGTVVGKAEPLEDVASELNYTTTKSAKGAAPQGDEEAAEQQTEAGEGGGGGGGLGGEIGRAHV